MRYESLPNQINIFDTKGGLTAKHCSGGWVHDLIIFIYIYIYIYMINASFWHYILTCCVDFLKTVICKKIWLPFKTIPHVPFIAHRDCYAVL